MLWHYLKDNTAVHHAYADIRSMLFCDNFTLSQFIFPQKFIYAFSRLFLSDRDNPML